MKERRPVIVIDDAIPFSQGVFEPTCEVRYIPGSRISAQDVKHADGLLIRTRTQCHRSLLEGSRVKCIATATIGYDHIDTAYLKEAGITWHNVPGCNALGVSQYISSALAFWAKQTGQKLSECTLGLIGLGPVGSAVRQAALQMGLQVLVNDPFRADRKETRDLISGEPLVFSTLEAIAQHCNVVSFHTPLTTDGCYPTYHLGDAHFFKTLKRCPLVINAARGGVIDEAALLLALEEHRVGACVIDCWDQEPHINKSLLKAALLATPHIAGYSLDGKANATRGAVKVLSDFFALNLDLDLVASIPKKAQISIQRNELSDALLRQYPIEADDQLLRLQPDCFERLRKEYNYRREVDFLVRESMDIECL